MAKSTPITTPLERSLARLEEADAALAAVDLRAIPQEHRDYIKRARHDVGMAASLVEMRLSNQKGA